MNWVSNLNRVIFAVLLLSFVAGTAQAGDGLFGRLRNKACRTKCAPVLTCEQLCIQKCYETYCKRVQYLEQYRCTKPFEYEFGIRMAKLGYCKGVKECRNPCVCQTAQTTAGAPIGEVVDPEQCRINLGNCVAFFSEWRDGTVPPPPPEPSSACIDAYFQCMGL